MQIKITGTPEEMKELFRTDEDSREQSNRTTPDAMLNMMLGNGNSSH
ncbi:hypothetical protein [Tetragenococcus halophilus]|nr:hypothetical protein [Tetragenococcus halophilus]